MFLNLDSFVSLLEYFFHVIVCGLTNYLCLLFFYDKRAKYIVNTIKALQMKPRGGAQWLSSLRGMDLEDVINSLSTLPGVGPKVASCVALFSLDQHHAVPVDTHVWQVNAQAIYC